MVAFISYKGKISQIEYGEEVGVYLVLKDKEVINRIVWDGSPYTPPEGCTLEKAPE